MTAYRWVQKKPRYETTLRFTHVLRGNSDMRGIQPGEHGHKTFGRDSVNIIVNTSSGAMIQRQLADQEHQRTFNLCDEQEDRQKGQDEI